MQPIPWSQRDIPLGRPIGELPMLLERLTGTPERLRELVAGAPIEILCDRSRDRWSIMDHAAHLLLVQQRFHLRIEEYRALCQRLSPLSFDDMEDWRQGNTQRQPGDLVEEFRLERRAFINEVMALPEGVLPHRAEHPCRGRGMRITDALHWLAEHDDHHLASMRLRIRV